MDEHGFQQGDTAAGRVYGASLAKRPNKAEVKQTSDTTWATIIEAITAEGRKLTPTVIQTGNTLQAQWFPPNIEDWAYDSTPSRWSNAEIALRWLRQIYLPETKPENDSEWRLLVLDQTSTHQSAEFMFEAFNNRVFLEYLPPHSSHLTQPLDVAVFGPVKTYYRQNTKFFASFDTSAPEQKKTLPERVSRGLSSRFITSQRNLRLPHCRDLAGRTA